MPCPVVFETSPHEEQIGKSIEVGDDPIVQSLRSTQRDHGSFRSAAHRSAYVEQRRRFGTTGKHELTQLRKLLAFS